MVPQQVRVLPTNSLLYQGTLNILTFSLIILEEENVAKVFYYYSVINLRRAISAQGLA